MRDLSRWPVVSEDARTGCGGNVYLPPTRIYPPSVILRPCKRNWIYIIRYSWVSISYCLFELSVGVCKKVGRVGCKMFFAAVLSLRKEERVLLHIYRFAHAVWVVVLDS